MKWGTSWTKTPEKKLRAREFSKPAVLPKGIKLPKISIEPALPYLGRMASKPARILARAFDQAHIRYAAELPQAGGNIFPGGSIVDFVLLDLHKVVRVQGEYWHASAEQRAKDDAKKLLLLAAGYRSDEIIDVWSKEIEVDIQAVLRRIGRLA